MPNLGYDRCKAKDRLEYGTRIAYIIQRAATVFNYLPCFFEST